jgi:hypothetical protein
MNPPNGMRSFTPFSVPACGRALHTAKRQFSHQVQTLLSGLGVCDINHSHTAVLKNSERAQNGDQNGDQNTSYDKKNKPAVAN